MPRLETPHPVCWKTCLVVFPASAYQVPVGSSIMKVRTISRHDSYKFLTGGKTNERVKCPKKIKKLEPGVTGWSCLKQGSKKDFSENVALAKT